MAVLVSKQDCNLSDANAFYVAENNAFGFYTGTISIATLTESLTFSSACNFLGVVLDFRLNRSDYVGRTATVKLQENVSGTWTDRLTMTKTLDEIVGANHKSFAPNEIYQGGWLVPFDWESTGGYPVTTAVGVWRLEVTQGGSGGNLTISRASTSVPFSYVAWTDVTATFANDDSILCKNIVTIDKSATFGGVLPAGVTTLATAIAVCSNVDGVDKPEDLAYLRWEDEPSGSYTMTMKGLIYLPGLSGFNIGTKEKPIPFSKKATINVSPSYIGTTFPSVFYTPNPYRGVGTSLFFYGETESNYRFTTLKADAAQNQPVIVTNDNVDWNPGDVIFIGKANVRNAAEFNSYTISTVVGDTITLTENITNSASAARLAGGTVVKKNNYSILIENPTGHTSNYTLVSPVNLVFDKVEWFNVSISSTHTSAVRQSLLLDKLKTESLITNCFFEADSNTMSYWYIGIVPEKGITCEDCVSYRTTPMANMNGMTSPTVNFKSGRFTQRRCRTINPYLYRPLGSDTIRATLDSNVLENQRPAVCGYNYRGTRLIATNNYVWGSAATFGNGGAFSVGTLINPIRISNNKAENCVNGLVFSANVTSNTIDDQMEFKDCVLDVGLILGAYPRYAFSNIILSDALTITNPYGVVIDGAIIGFTNYDSTPNDDFSLHSTGTIQRTTTGLADTTVRTTGGSAFRFEPVAAGDSFEYSFEIPTGNIQSKVMTLNVWVKIAHADYYSGDKTMPFLSVEYDDGENSVTSTAIESTNWQLLSVTFTPTTTSGRVSVTIGGVGSVVGANGYFYFDDFSTIYPLDSSVDFGTFDIWSRGMPVLPPIKTALSPADVWGVDPSTFSAGSVGERLNKIKKDTGLIAGLY